MKPAALLAILGFAVSAFAGTLPAQEPTMMTRDVQTVNSIVAEVSAAIAKLDASVKSLAGTQTKAQLQADAKALVDVMTKGAATIGASASIDIGAAAGLQAGLAGLVMGANVLVVDLVAAKAKIEAAGMCAVVLGFVADVGVSAKALVDAALKICPSGGQGPSVITGSVGGMVDLFAKVSVSFGVSVCKDSTTAAGGYQTGGQPPKVTSSALAIGISASASASASVGGGIGGSIVHTVTVPGEGCSTTLPDAPFPTPTATATAQLSLGQPSQQTITSRVTSTVRTTTANIVATPTTTGTPVVTAGAIANAVAPLGLVAVFAALAL